MQRRRFYQEPLLCLGDFNDAILKLGSALIIINYKRDS